MTITGFIKKQRKSTKINLDQNRTNFNFYTGEKMYSTLLIYISIIIIISIIVICFIKDSIQKAYWKGRFEGWKNCEDMAISRAKKCKYDMNKFLPDILQ